MHMHLKKYLNMKGDKKKYAYLPNFSDIFLTTNSPVRCESVAGLCC